jgi:predicted ATPase
MYSEELIEYWQTHNLVTKNGTGFEVVADPLRLVNIPIPERIQKAITGRLDNLPPMELLILKTASTIGVNFTLNELINHYPLKREANQLAAGLVYLEQLQFIRRVGSGEYPVYTFVYGLVREVANSLLSESVRRQILGGRNRPLVDEVAI